jgi:hypothetical protein
LAPRLKNDETRPTINKSKHPIKGRIQGKNRKDIHPRRQKNHQKRANHQVPKPPLVMKSISTKEMGGPLKRCLA